MTQAHNCPRCGANFNTALHCADHYRNCTLLPNVSDHVELHVVTDMLRALVKEGLETGKENTLLREGVERTHRRALDADAAHARASQALANMEDAMHELDEDFRNLSAAHKSEMRTNKALRNALKRVL